MLKGKKEFSDALHKHYHNSSNGAFDVMEPLNVEVSVFFPFIAELSIDAVNKYASQAHTLCTSPQLNICHNLIS